MIQIMLIDLFRDYSLAAKRASFAADHAVFLRGRPVTHLYCVETGRVALTRTLADGGTISVASAGPRQSFAEAALYSDVYHCDAVCIRDSTIIAFSAAAVRDLLTSDARAASRYNQYLAGQVRELRARLEILRIKTAADRLMAWLRANASGAPLAVAIDQSWAAIAAEIGLTPEAVYRARARLRKERRISEQSGRVMLASG
jgi:CRP-like cAMP-binding protein